MNLTPLIDVVFLLLVFFMLASTFLKFGTVKLDTAGGGGGTGDLATIALIHVGAGERFYVAGQPVEAADLDAALQRLRTQGRTDAVIALRKDATASDLVKALARIRKSEFNSVRVVD